MEIDDQDRNGRTTPSCAGCGGIWHQKGNRSGHCSNCHETFGSLSAFDRHQRMIEGKVVCFDPESVGLVMSVDKVGTEQWRCPGTWTGPKREEETEE